MSTIPTNPDISADDRYELAARAVNQERAAQPTHLVALSMVALVVCAVVLVMAWRSSSSASEALERERYEREQVTGLIAQITTLEAAAQENTGADPYAQIPDILTRLTQFGREVGLENPLSLPDSETPRLEGNVRLMSYQYTVRDPALGRVLEWIEVARQRIPGLEVRRLTITPGRQFWTVNATLSRYERIQ